MESATYEELKNGQDHYGIVEYEDYMEFIAKLEREQDEHDINKKQRTVFLARLLLDEEMEFVIQNVFDSNNDTYLNSIVEEILSNELLFMRAVFHKQGSNFIAQVIEKLKSTDIAFRVTKTLAPWTIKIMTHPIARVVTQTCLYHLNPCHNKVLYEHVICHFYELATDEEGCISVAECIDTISGEQRTRLLSSIANCSLKLSNDSYGNYVLQHVLESRNDEVNLIILNKLKGQFVSLSLEEESSHLIEKSLECCNLASFAIVNEILDKSDAFTLAQHPFGNTVIQKALAKTKLKL